MENTQNLSSEFKTKKTAQKKMNSLFEGENPSLKKRWTMKGEKNKRQGYCTETGKNVPVVATTEERIINNDEIKKAAEEGTDNMKKEVRYKLAVVCPNVKNCLDARGANGEVSDFTNYLESEDGSTKCPLERNAHVSVIATEAISLSERIRTMTTDLLKNLKEKWPY